MTEWAATVLCIIILYIIFNPSNEKKKGEQ